MSCGVPNRFIFPKAGKGDRVVSLVCLGIVFVFTPLALANVLRTENLLPSFLWLALMVLLAADRIREHSLRLFFIEQAGIIAGREYLAWSDGELVSGVRFLGRDWERERIAPHRIESVEWTAGQATEKVGRDMQDWHLILWLDLENPKKRWENSRKPDQELRVFGPHQPQAEAEKLARSFLDFLRAGGVVLVPGTEENVFARDESLAPERRSR